MSKYNLKRFHEAQEKVYQNALNEIRMGRKATHWMWFIFPQLTGLGYSETAQFYAIADLQEAELYLEDPVLSSRLVQICKALLEIKGKSASEIFGSPDNLKLKSSITLFSAVKNSDPVFQEVLEHYFAGKKDEKTLGLLRMGYC